MNQKNIFSQCKGFEWDNGNLNKNWIKHGVSWQECEQVFFNDPFLLFDDLKHSQNEIRYYALGRTDLNKHIMLVFAIRNEMIRIISATSMSRKEQKSYEEAKKHSKI